MKISAQTKISEIIRHNNAAIEAIVSINKHFEKLRNPILRKVLASRVSIADASKIAGCTIEDFFRTLLPLGFEKEEKSLRTGSESIRKGTLDINTISEKNIITLDVRAEIASNVDPFQIIMKELEILKESYVLKLVNSFEPSPLIRMLENRGYEFSVTNPEAGVYNTYFRKPVQASTEIAEKKVSESCDLEFGHALEKYQGRMRTIDVRNLEMPEPMVKTLEELGKLPTDWALMVHHRRIPKYLLSELEERKYKWLFRTIKNDYLQILIFKA